VLPTSHPKSIEPAIIPPLLALIFLDLHIFENVVIPALRFAAMSYDEGDW
jgi:hypothetical protein